MSFMPLETGCTASSLCCRSYLVIAEKSCFDTSAERANVGRRQGWREGVMGRERGREGGRE